jgi:hypothetical protein
MGYSFNRFLKTINETDQTIKVYDDRNYPVHTINPFSVLRVYATNNNLIVVLTGNIKIVLDFLNGDEASAGLVKIQSYIDTIKNAGTVIPTPIDIDEAILSSVGIKAFNGSTASVQTIKTLNDNNIEISMGVLNDMAVSTASVTSTIHTLSINWTGILPIERGGLNNTMFTPNQILISNLDSIISSGYTINDLGTTDKDIWSAKKILNQIGNTNVNKEIPVGAIDGVNKTFILSYEPLENSEHLYLNGLLQDSDDDTDYTIVGNRIVFVDPPMEGSKLRCSYTIARKDKTNQS